MVVSDSRTKIGVFSHGGTKNLGDEALLAAVIQSVRRHAPDAEVVGFTINPADTRARHGIPSFPIRRTGTSLPSHQDTPVTSPGANSGAASVSTPATSSAQGSSSGLRNALKSIPGLRRLLFSARNFFEGLSSALAEPAFLFQSYRNLKGVDLILVAGSQQLNDGYGGAWGFPYTLYKWTLLSKLTGTRVAILSVGAGPITKPLSKFFFRRVLNMVDYRSYRDDISSKLMQTMGIKGEHPVFPDLVYSLQLPAPRAVPSDSSRAVVGTNPVPFFDGRYWPTPDPVRYDEYVRKFARFAEWLDKSGNGVLFFPTQVRADVLTIQDIRHQMNGSGNSPNILAGNTVENLEDLVSEIARTDFVIANRYHGILISLMMNKPVLGVAYHEKSRALLAQAGQADYVLNIADFKTEELMERFSSMKANAPAIKKRIAEQIEPLRKALDLQYQRVFALIGVEPSAPKAN